ncbi:tRNA pseudouridine(55) synthase TruB [Legionella jordanis]|uniref:tRNA pseudouridine synthase B n=1 Tax=Legionella jordanis TaxID=456 RepID=A0A0W0VDF5_9GAMM|nr:tRNA pseudouridine(55) synthase TruB [Legionella jordanis]KTD18144.1 tRNA pseudouridine synthase B [Legionella jordanis]RMX00546.1 tRNA pseudouridine(55) synthase TruB [Legionella jordanis]RMX21337.1 tRNA pseudouridine(55) synthase TruB [Legionella jordanis]VEH13763.1 tRNA pseudouridine synthase B [Legionella jordanis]
MKKTDSIHPINGILLLNKPKGFSSNAVLQKAKRLFQAKKAGHTGSLDPLATGMLPICFGEATKFCQYLLDADKVYEATGVLGIKTNTGDAMGEMVEEKKDFIITEAELLAAIANHRGQIKQTPSMFSALKHKGVPLYKFAREGIVLPREGRSISIHELSLQRFNGQQFDIRVNCSKGTYIRNLVEDIGDFLGVGAHISRLHRLHTSGFANEKMFDFEELEKKTFSELLDCLLPMDRAVNHLPSITLGESEVQSLRQGKALMGLGLNHLLGCVRLYDEAAHFIGLGECLPDRLIVKRLLTDLATKTIL